MLITNKQKLNNKFPIKNHNSERIHQFHIIFYIPHRNHNLNKLNFKFKYQENSNQQQKSIINRTGKKTLNPNLTNNQIQWSRKSHKSNNKTQFLKQIEITKFRMKLSRNQSLRENRVLRRDFDFEVSSFKSFHENLHLRSPQRIASKFETRDSKTKTTTDKRKSEKAQQNLSSLSLCDLKQDIPQNMLVYISSSWSSRVTCGIG